MFKVRATLMADEAHHTTSTRNYVQIIVQSNIFDGMIQTNGIESFWATIKRGYMGICHNWSKKHLHRYINEFTFRYNSRGKDIIQCILKK